MSALQLRRQDQIDQFDSLNSNRFAQVHPYVGYVEEPRADSGFAPYRGGPAVPVSEYGYIDDKLPFRLEGPAGSSSGSWVDRSRVTSPSTGPGVSEAELAKDSRFAGKELVFVNLALGGYKQPQQLMTLAYLLSLGAEFDVILNIDGFNEVARRRRSRSGSNSQFPAFPRSWRTRIASQRHEPGSQPEQAVAARRRASRLGPAVRPQPLALFDRVQPRLGTARPPA